MRRRSWLLSLAVAAVSGCATKHTSSVPAHYGAYHQHLISPSTATLLKGPVLDGESLVRMLDRGGIRRGVVLSIAYTYADERKKVPDPDRRVREENDWTAGQIAVSNGRLTGFCSVNPMRDAALAEFRRCVRLPGMRGLKLHFGNSGVSMRQPEQARRLVALFAAANAQRAPIVVHLRNRTDGPYGREDGEAFLRDLLPAAPDVVVQVAHLAGSGGYDDDADAVMGVFADAFARHDRRVRNLYFDVTSNVMADTGPNDLKRMATRIRQVGARRVLFGSDLPVAGLPTPAEAWALFRDRIPLSSAEIRQIAGNRTPYFR